MNYNELFDKLWRYDGIHPFGNPFRFEEYVDSLSEDVETDSCEFVKGDFKTTITCKFNKQGFLVGHSVLSTCITDGEDLDNIMQRALDEEDYMLAAAVKRRIDASR